MHRSNAVHGRRRGAGGRIDVRIVNRYILRMRLNIQVYRLLCMIIELGTNWGQSSIRTTQVDHHTE